MRRKSWMGKGEGTYKYLHQCTASLSRVGVRAEMWMASWRPFARNDHKPRKVDMLKADSSYRYLASKLDGKNGYKIREHS